MIDPIFILEAVVNGILLGGVLALLALGLNLIFGVIDIVWIAYVDLVALCMYAVYFLVTAYGWPLWLAGLQQARLEAPAAHGAEAVLVVHRGLSSVGGRQLSAIGLQLSVISCQFLVSSLRGEGHAQDSRSGLPLRQDRGDVSMDARRHETTRN